MDKREEMAALKMKMQAATNGKRPGGYMALSKDEQKRYSQLKKEVEAEDNVPNIPHNEDDSDKIVVSKSELEALKREILAISELHQKSDGLEKHIGLGDWEEFTPANKRNKQATFRLWQEDSESPFGLIVDYKFHKNEYDENTRKHNKPIYMWTLLYEDGTTKEIEYPLLDMVQSENRETVELIDKEEKEMIKHTGEKVRVPLQDKSGYTMSSSKGVNQLVGDTTVELTVGKKEIKYLARRASGQEFWVDASRLNM